jgi:MFS family permease
MPMSKPMTSDAPMTAGYRRYLLTLLLIVSIVAYSDRLILGFLVDPIKADLGVSDTQIGLLNGLAFSLCYAVMGLLLGRAIDTHRRNVVLAACIGFWSLCTMSCGFAIGVVTLFIARCGIGVGEAAMNPSALSLIASAYPRDRLVRAMAIYSVGVVGGGGVAILLGGQLIAYLRSLGSIDLFGFHGISVWRFVFMLIGAPGIIAALAVLLTVREQRRPEKDARAGVAPELDIGVGRFLWERRAVYLPLIIGLCFFGFYNYSVLGWYPAMLARTYHVGPGTISIAYGLIYLVSGISGSLLSPTIARLLAKRFPGEATLIGLLLTAGFTLPPALIGPLLPSFAGAIGSFVLTWFCSAMQTSMAFSSLVLVTPERRRGVVVAIYVMLMNLTGGALGTVIVGWLSDHVFGPEHLNRAIVLMAIVALPISTAAFAWVRPAFRKAVAAEDESVRAAA